MRYKHHCNNTSHWSNILYTSHLNMTCWETQWTFHQPEEAAGELCGLSITRWVDKSLKLWHHPSNTRCSPWTTESWDNRKKNHWLNQPTPDNLTRTLLTIQSMHTLPVSIWVKESSAQHTLHTPSEHDSVKKTHNLHDNNSARLRRWIPSHSKYTWPTSS